MNCEPKRVLMHGQWVGNYEYGNSRQKFNMIIVFLNVFDPGPLFTILILFEKPLVIAYYSNNTFKNFFKYI